MSQQQMHYINGFAVSVDAGASATASPIEMPRDGYDVEFDRISITALNSGAVVEPNFTLQLTEQGGSNRTLFVQPQHARNLAGNGSQSWDLPAKWRVPGSVRVSMDVVGLHASGTLDVYVTLAGRRVPAQRAP